MDINDIDIDKIALDALEETKNSSKNTSDNAYAGIAFMIYEVSAKVTAKMLKKYHEELLKALPK